MAEQVQARVSCIRMEQEFYSLSESILKTTRRAVRLLFAPIVTLLIALIVVMYLYTPVPVMD